MKLKRILFAFFLILFVANASAFSIEMMSRTTTGQGAWFTTNGVVYTVQCRITTGTPSAVTISLTGSLDQTNASTLATHVFTAGELTAAFAAFSVLNSPVDNLQVSLDTLTGAGTIVCDVLSEASS